MKGERERYACGISFTVVGRTMAMSLFRVLRLSKRASVWGATYTRSPYFTLSVTQVNT